MNVTPIEWADFTSNAIKFRNAAGDVVWGCVHVSPGCQHCYAETLAKRYGRGGPFNAPTMAKLTPFIDDKELRQMLSAKRVGGQDVSGSRVFIGDMTDIFGDWVTYEMLDRLFAVFALRPDVTWMVLTKRAERMRAYLGDPSFGVRVGAHLMDTARGVASAEAAVIGITHRLTFSALENVWLGVSVEDQQRADERIPLLLQTPAAVRFISAEPLLGPVDLERVYIAQRHYVKDALRRSDIEPPLVSDAKVDWLIAGGESGHGARPCNLSWIRSLVCQCAAAGVPAFVKQLGSKPLERFERRPEDPARVEGWTALRDNAGDGSEQWYRYLPLSDRKGGNMADWPEPLRVRQFPGAAVRA